MTWPMILILIVLASTALGLLRLLRRLVWPFALASGVLLALHFQTDPAQAATGMAALGGGLGLSRPLGRMLRFRLF